MIQIIVPCFLALLVLSGCVPKKPVPKTPLPPQPKVINTPPKKVVKPVQVYPYCAKHQKIASHAYGYIINEFESAYIKTKDYNGAKAQLFLIDNHSSTSFAQNINAAQATYERQYDLAQKNGCDMMKFDPSPLESLRKRVNALKP